MAPKFFYTPSIEGWILFPFPVSADAATACPVEYDWNPPVPAS